VTKYMNYLYEVDCLLFRIINGKGKKKMAESILYHDYPYGRCIFYDLRFDCTDPIFYKSMESYGNRKRNGLGHQFHTRFSRKKSVHE